MRSRYGRRAFRASPIRCVGERIKATGVPEFREVAWRAWFNHNGVLLVDGGVLNPVPIAPAFNEHTDLKIAVNLSGAVTGTKSVKRPIEPVNQPSFLHKQVTNFIDNLRNESASTLDLDWGMYDVANQSFDAMQSTIARQKLATYPPDIRKRQLKYTF